MRHQKRGTLTLFLITCIAMVMILSFGFSAALTADQCEVVNVKSEYAQIIRSAKAFAAR